MSPTSPTFALQALLAPMGDAAPSGPNLEYDASFLALDTAARGTPERQAGDTILAAEPPLWPTILHDALALAAKTRDLRLAALIARSGARARGLQGYWDGLQLTALLLETQWHSVHPQLDADDNNDPTMRLNALATLLDSDMGLADLRGARVGQGPTAFTVRQIELALGKADALPGESAPSRDGLVTALQTAEAQQPGSIECLRATHDTALRLEACIAQHLGAAEGPDWRPLRRITDVLRLAADAAQGLESVATEDSNAGTPSVSATTSSGDLKTRDDAVRALGRVSDWIEKNEPSNPAPLLIRRAQRLMSMSFMDIVRDLAPEGLGQLETIAGKSDS
jgi:type VI secretion system protein ImpA